MVIFCQILGWLSLIGGVIAGLVSMADNFLIGLLALVIAVINAAPWFILANLLDRVDTLEWITRKQAPPTIDTKPTTPQTKSLEDALNW